MGASAPSEAGRDSRTTPAALSTFLRKAVHAEQAHYLGRHRVGV